MMKRIVFLALALCLLRAQCFALVTGYSHTQSEEPPSYTVLYDFEESGTPTGITATGTVDFDTEGINGESAYINAATSTSSFYYGISHTVGTTIWTRLKVNFSHLPTGVSTTLQFVTCNSAGTARAYAQIINASSISYFRVQSVGGTAVTGTTALATDTDYIIDIGCAESSGTNGYMALDFSTSGMPQHSGANFIESTDGTATATIDRMVFQGSYSSSVNYVVAYFDDIGEL